MAKPAKDQSGTRTFSIFRDALAAVFQGRDEGFRPRQLLIELSVALVLSVAYFFCVKPYAVGIPGNTTNGYVFTSLSLSNFQPELIYDVWKGRLSGMLLSGYLFDLLVNHSTGNFQQYFVLFGLYQALWLFLMFFIIILSLRCSLLINLGIFAGLMYNFLPASGLYFYPWDIPATLFFTLAVLFFERGRLWLMTAAVCVGCFFKETVLVCALLTLFAGPWKWWKRILVFGGLAAVYVLGKKILLAQLQLKGAALSMNDAKSLAGLLDPKIFLGNLRLLFSPFAFYVILANAGTMAAVLAGGWRRRFLPYMTVILAFLAGQIMYGAINEFRIFMQILPLSLILLIERWEERVVPKPSGRKRNYDLRLLAQSPKTSPPGWALRNNIPALVATTFVVIGLSIAVSGWQYYVVLGRGGATGSGMKGKRELKRIKQVETACAWYQNGLAATRSPYKSTFLNVGIGHVNGAETRETEFQDAWFERRLLSAEMKLAELLMDVGYDAEAMAQYRVVLGLQSNVKPDSLIICANNNLACLLATASDPRLRNGDEAVRLAERACELTHYQEANLIGTLAAAFAEAGRWPEAEEAARNARTVALAHGEKAVASKNEELLKLYQSRTAFHQEAKPSP